MIQLNKVFATALCTAVSFAASAIPFQGTYDVTVNTSTDGLQVAVTPENGSLAFDLAPGQQTSWISLFRISTPESTVNSDDTVPLAATIDFAFVLPTIFGGSADGTTQGASLFYGLWQQGELHWAYGGLSSLYFDGGILDVFLQDPTFGGGFLGLSDDANTVNAKFSYRAGATQPVAVSEPATLALLGVGLLLVGLIVRRRSVRG